MIIGGGDNAQLTPKGRYDARNLGLGLSDVEFISAYNSTLGRAYETADIILNDTKLSLIEDTNLDEIFLGYWESDKISNIKNNQLSQVNNLVSAHHVINFVSPNGDEDGIIGAYRFKHALSTIAKQHEFEQGQVVIFNRPLIFKAFANQALPDTELTNSSSLLKVTLQYKNENFSIKEIVSYSGK